MSTSSETPKNFMQPTDHSEYQNHPDHLGPPSSVSMWEISTSLKVLSEQTHPWERAWDEPVSSSQSCTKSKGKGKPHLLPRDNHCCLTTLFFPLEAQTVSLLTSLLGSLLVKIQPCLAKRTRHQLRSIMSSSLTG